MIMNNSNNSIEPATDDNVNDMITTQEEVHSGTLNIVVGSSFTLRDEISFVENSEFKTDEMEALNLDQEIVQYVEKEIVINEPTCSSNSDTDSPMKSNDAMESYNSSIDINDDAFVRYMKKESNIDPVTISNNEKDISIPTSINPTSNVVDNTSENENVTSSKQPNCNESSDSNQRKSKRLGKFSSVSKVNKSVQLPVGKNTAKASKQIRKKTSNDVNISGCKKVSREITADCSSVHDVKTEIKLNNAKKNKRSPIIKKLQVCNTSSDSGTVGDVTEVSNPLKKKKLSNEAFDNPQPKKRPKNDPSKCHISNYNSSTNNMHTIKPCSVIIEKCNNRLSNVVKINKLHSKDECIKASKDQKDNNKSLIKCESDIKKKSASSKIKVSKKEKLEESNDPKTDANKASDSNNPKGEDMNNFLHPENVKTLRYNKKRKSASAIITKETKKPVDTSKSSVSIDDPQANHTVFQSQKQIPVSKEYKDVIKNWSKSENQSSAKLTMILNYLKANKSLTIERIPVTPSSNVPVQTSLNNVPVQISLNYVPVQTSSNNIPVQTSSNNIPVQTSSNNVPVQTSSNNIPSILTPSNSCKTKTSTDNEHDIQTNSTNPLMQSLAQPPPQKGLHQNTKPLPNDLDDLLDEVPPFIREVFNCDNIRDGFIKKDLIFVLSLLPDMEEMGDTEKLQFQLRVIKTIRDVLTDPLLKI